MKMYRYWHLETNLADWAESAQSFRIGTGLKKGTVVRVAYRQEQIPKGWQATTTRKSGISLADEPIVRIQTKEGNRKLRDSL